jgi:hypothetical protein
LSPNYLALSYPPGSSRSSHRCSKSLRQHLRHRRLPRPRRLLHLPRPPLLLLPPPLPPCARAPAPRSISDTRTRGSSLLVTAWLRSWRRSGVLQRLAGLAALTENVAGGFRSQTQQAQRFTISPVSSQGTANKSSAFPFKNKLPEKNAMPALLIPVLWVGGAVVLLGGGYYIIHIMH